MVQCKKCKLFVSTAKEDTIKCKGGCDGILHKKCARKVGLKELCDDCGNKGSPTTPRISLEPGNVTVEALLKEVNKKLEIVYNIEKKVQEMSDRIDEYSERYGELVEFKERAESKIIALERKNVYLQKCNVALEERVEMLEQKEKEKVIELACVDELEHEKLDEVVASIAQKLDLETEDIEQVRRVGAPKKKVDTELGDKQARARPIVVTMRTKAARDQWINKRKTRLTNGAIFGNNNQKRIYINEDMTKFKRQLFWSAKNQLKPTYSYVWFQKSNILVKKSESEKKIYNIRSEEDIKSLIENIGNTAE
ncbi:uncharacterized protein LOC134658091 [Cydia amplana]|uniref:uncharacterized protein LOC134658091 n=1 Tax=Cydia amplana TaxID=1869771 RepID=UPI002FE66157